MPKIPPKAGTLAPFWSTADGETVRLYLGNVVYVLARLPEKSVHMCVTSPPYWGLRDYSTCNCSQSPAPSNIGENGSGPSRGTEPGRSKRQPDPNCPRCKGTGRDEVVSKMQIGSEPSPDCLTSGQAQCGRCFVCNMVAVFRGVRRVLRDDGTCWLNLGDSYSGGKVGREDLAGHKGSFGGRNVVPVEDGDKFAGSTFRQRKAEGIPSGNLVGVPWRVTLALQADGWVLRQDIIWHKPSPMPESVRNRCTKAHEYVFLLTKGNRYFYDADAIKEKANPDTDRTPHVKGVGLAPGHPDHLGLDDYDPSSGCNKRSVWRIASRGYPGAHFATFPPELPEICILAGTSAHGCCADCGAPWRRVTEETKLRRERPNDYVKRTGEEGTGNSCSNSVAGVAVETVGWEPGCECGTEEVVPCTVCDPFIGSGTTCAVSLEHGRRSVGIDLSEQYLRDNAVPRIEGVLLSKPETAWLAGRKAKRATVGKPAPRKTRS